LSEPVKVKVALLLVMMPVGPAVMMVSGGSTSTGVYVTVSVASPLLPAASFAMTHMTLLPFFKDIPFIAQEVVPDAVPVAFVLLFTHVTSVTLTLSEAVPKMLMVVWLVG
jgi:hypothetical protein